MNNSRPLLPLALAASLLLAACSGEPVAHAAGERPRAERTTPVQILEIAPRDLSRSVEIAGTVQPLRTIRLAARTEGVLTEVLVEEGDRVERGQLLARIDVREQEAELARARAVLGEKRAAFERLNQLRERNYVDAASLQTARAEVEIAESEVRLWQTRVEFSRVQSSIEGTVVVRHVEPGEAISRHATLFELADLSSLVVRLGVSELDIHNLKVGDHVPLRLDALAGIDPVPGRIRRIFPAADADSRLITVEVELVDAGQLGVRPGYLVRAQLLVDQRRERLAVPVASLAESGGEHYVMVVDSDGRLERRRVQPGPVRGAWREVLGGLQPGDRVVAANPREMNEGDRVRIVDILG